MIKVEIIIDGNPIQSNALVDSGASMNYISSSFLNSRSIIPSSLSETRQVRLANGKHVTVDSCLSEIPVSLLSSVPGFRADDLGPVNCGFIVTSLTHDVILGLPWLKAVNPTIDWRILKLAAISEPSPTLCVSEICKPPGAPVQSATLDATNLTHDLESQSTPDNQMILPDSVQLTYERFASVFYELPVDSLPPERTIDLEIQLKDESAPPPNIKLYHLSYKEQGILKSWVDENLAKGFIRPSSSPYAAPIFFVSKKDGSLRP